MFYLLILRGKEFFHRRVRILFFGLIRIRLFLDQIWIWIRFLRLSSILYRVRLHHIDQQRIRNGCIMKIYLIQWICVPLINGFRAIQRVLLRGRGKKWLPIKILQHRGYKAIFPQGPRGEIVSCILMYIKILTFNNFFCIAGFLEEKKMF